VNLLVVLSSRRIRTASLTKDEYRDQKDSGQWEFEITHNEGEM
jgi:hypothetical protein